MAENIKTLKVLFASLNRDWHNAQADYDLYLTQTNQTSNRLQEIRAQMNAIDAAIIAINAIKEDDDDNPRPNAV